MSGPGEDAIQLVIEEGSRNGKVAAFLEFTDTAEFARAWNG